MPDTTGPGADQSQQAADLSTWTRAIAAQLEGLPLGSPRAVLLIEELAAHLRDRYDDLRAGGADDDAARAAVLDDLRGRGRDLLTPLLEELQRGAPPPPIAPGAPPTGRLFADLWRDLRYGARLLRRHPGFTAIAVLTLALGLGATTTVFTIVNTLVLQPLPVVDIASLVAIETRERAGAGDPRRGGTTASDDDSHGERLLPISHPNLQDLRTRNTVFSEVAGYSAPMTATLSTGGAPERIFVELVTGNYFDTIGISPALGRFFRPEEDQAAGAHPVVVLSYGTWQQRFGGAPDVIGRTMRINRAVFTIIGVAPEGYKTLNGVFGPNVWAPAMMMAQLAPAQQRTWLTDRGALGFRAVGRLRPDATLPRAAAQTDALAAALEREHPEINRKRRFAVRRLSRISGPDGQALIAGSAGLMAVVGFVLLIACSNVANLLLARGAGRRQEVAVRLALGAGRWRLMRQLLTESVLLAVISGLLGLVLAYVGAQVLWSFRPPEVAQNLIDPALDANVLLFGLAVSVLTGVIFGTAPAFQSTRAAVVDAMKEEARSAGRTRRRVTIGRVLLVGQVALSLVSLIAAGLFLRSIQRAYAIDPGFETTHLGIVLVSPGQAGYDRPRSEQFYRDARVRLAAMPGVAAVSWATNLPFWARPSRAIVIEGQEDTDRARGRLTIVNTIERDYFGAMRIALRRGRDFADTDREGSRPVAIVNETLAAAYWPNQDPIGKRFTFRGERVPREVIGVAATANYETLGEPPQPCVYVPLRQNFADTVVLYVRAADRDPALVLREVQRELRAFDDQIEVADVRTGQKLLSQALFGATMSVGLLGVFGVLALALASLGLYGVMAYSVTQRQREIGVRMALGAGQRSVLRLVLREGLTLVGTGVAIGLAAALVLGMAVSRLLYGVSPADPVSLLVASLVLFAAAALACYLPARRASRLDPLSALREA